MESLVGGWGGVWEPPAQEHEVGVGVKIVSGALHQLRRVRDIWEYGVFIAKGGSRVGSRE
jgi:hypothetical protein